MLIPDAQERSERTYHKITSQGLSLSDFCFLLGAFLCASCFVLFFFCDRTFIHFEIRKKDYFTSSFNNSTKTFPLLRTLMMGGIGLAAPYDPFRSS